MALLRRRAGTALVLFLVLTSFFFVLSTSILGGIAGARVATQQGYATGIEGYRESQEAGQAIYRKFGPRILLWAGGAAALISAALSFGGVFSWCRPSPVPPPLPPAPAGGVPPPLPSARVDGGPPVLPPPPPPFLPPAS
jgi:hypothetical protein